MFVISPKNFGFAAGILWGASILLMTWLNLITGYAAVFLSVLSDIYPGYSASFFGSFLGLIYGFIDGFICFYLLGWLYNFLEH